MSKGVEDTLREKHSCEVRSTPIKPVSMEVDMHTVFILCGPSRSGKSTFARSMHSVLTRLMTEQGVTQDVVTILSSDRYRNMLTGRDGISHYCTQEMMESSSQAFGMLNTELETYTTFPVNRPFVIVDTTGLDEAFRKGIVATAEKNGYKTHIVLFDYSHSDYFKYLPEGNERQYREVIQNHIKRFKIKVLPVVRSKDFDRVTRIRSRDFLYTPMKVTISTKNLSKEISVGPEDNVVIIGDVHEHSKALKDLVLLTETKFKSGDTKYVFIGDYLDKGGDTKGTIDLIWTLMHAKGALMIRANHENYVVKRLKGELVPNLELEKKSFSSLEFLSNPANKEYSDKVIEIWDKSLPFLKIHRKDAHTVYVTHAPCKNEVIGKYSENGQRDQRNLRRYMEDDARKHYEFIFKEASYNHPLHVFGHVAHCAEKLNYKNKWFLDTGAVYGGKLSALVVSAHAEEVIQVSCDKLFEYEEKSLRTDAATPVVVEKPFKIWDYDLSDRDLKYVNRMVKSPIKYISGTMAPAPSTNTEIESLEAGLNYFRDKGVYTVVLEPKYMGSRCQVYLFRDAPEKSFAVSRNGFMIKREGIQKVLDEQYEKYIKEDYWKESLIMDGEILPWSFLGSSLISHDFESYGDVICAELSSLDFDKELAKLDLAPQLKIEERCDHLNTFYQQLGIYGTNVDPYFKAFQMLSIDGKEVVTMNQASSFDMVSEDERAVLDLGSATYLEEAKAFFEAKVTSEKMEGIVIKPYLLSKGVAPYMKVRNEGYLHLIYGYDYKMRYKALSEKKRIGRKLATSVQEHDLALALLTDDGSRRTELVVKMVAELNREKSLDPRL